jgi:spore germination cell wall hydrolase CwlJ-like protein
MTPPLNYTEVRDKLNSLDAVRLSTLLLYGEARGEEVLGQVGVLCVALNRAKLGGWYGIGLTGANGVILKPWQFSCFNENDPNLPKLAALINSPDAVFHTLRGVASVVLTNTVRDPTNGATHYANLAVCDPTWARKFTLTVKIGRHTFFLAKE